MEIENNSPKKHCLTFKSSQQAEMKLVNHPAGVLDLCTPSLDLSAPPLWFVKSLFVSV